MDDMPSHWPEIFTLYGRHADGDGMTMMMMRDTQTDTTRWAV